MIRVIYTRQADEELRQIWRYLAQSNEMAADKVVQAIGTKINRLQQHPRIGRRRRDIRASARMLVEGSYLVLYETHPDTDEGPVDWVEVVSIVDGRRNLADLY